MNMFFKKEPIYTYPNSDVLVNKLNIRDFDKLSNMERQIVSINETMLISKPVSGEYDLNHMKLIHKKLFGDIYDWAGELRVTNIKKSDSSFCDVANIESDFNLLHKQLKQERYLKYIMSKDELVDSLTKYFAEINRIHPFREGNGRTQRLYFRQMVSENLCFDLDFTNISSEQMMSASKNAMNGNYDLMRDVMMTSVYRKGVSYRERTLPDITVGECSIEGDEYE